MMINQINCILILNIGSSSIKFQLFSLSHDLQLILKGQIINLNQQPVFEYELLTNKASKQIQKLPKHSTHETALHFVLNWLFQFNQKWNIKAVTHRIVHGGREFDAHTLIDEDVFIRLKSLTSLAPMHQRDQVNAVEIIRHLNKNIIQIACFDTIFHSSRSPIYTEYALPKKIRDYGVHKYGFHGLSYEWVVHSLLHDYPHLAKGRVVAAHLGSGASLCAINKGKSIDTTMGFTPLEGLVMGTRCGSIDPSIVIYMIKELGYSCDEVENILNKQSGLLGLSELSPDVHRLEKSNEQKATFALEYFCTKVAQMMGMMIVALKGVDAIIFTGGIGENSSLVREMIQNFLSFLPPIEIHIIKANEEWIMGKHALKILACQPEKNVSRSGTNNGK